MSKIYLHLKFEIDLKDEQKLFSYLRKAIPVYLSKYISSIKLLKDYKFENKYIEIIEYENISDFDEDQKRINNDPITSKLIKEWRKIVRGDIHIEVFEDLSNKLN